MPPRPRATPPEHREAGGADVNVRVWRHLDEICHRLHAPSPWVCRRYDLALLSVVLWTPDRRPRTCRPHPPQDRENRAR